jgi:hypothetical protein
MERWVGMLAWAWAVCGASGCATQQATFASTDPVAAAINVAVAAAATGAVGCKFQGCPYGSYCDQNTGWCVARRCGDGCPDGTVCNEGLDRCQAPAPPATPNDWLPTDRPADWFPPMH